ncbi:MAG: hypothetical protein IMY68_07745 [Bacteroidetes bacterium]|nr:hypothetical protein [Bacteroidota bacterium]
MPRRLIIPFLFLVSLLLYSCRRHTLPETLEAHYVKYNISYMESMAGDVPTRILPAKMDSWYTDYFVVTRINGFFNQFSLIQIADLRNKRVSTLLNLFGNKVYYRGERGELPAGIIAPAELHIQTTGKQSVIGGLNSEQVKIDTGSESFTMYYTRDFSVRRPNLSTPYSSINYPLSDFRIQLSYLKMHLTCAEYEPRIIESEIFTVPDDYRLVSRPVMEEFINSLFTKE